MVSGQIVLVMVGDGDEIAVHARCTGPFGEWLAAGVVHADDLRHVGAQLESAASATELALSGDAPPDMVPADDPAVRVAVVTGLLDLDLTIRVLGDEAGRRFLEVSREGLSPVVDECTVPVSAEELAEFGRGLRGSSEGTTLLLIGDSDQGLRTTTAVVARIDESRMTREQGHGGSVNVPFPTGELAALRRFLASVATHSAAHHCASWHSSEGSTQVHVVASAAGEWDPDGRALVAVRITSTHIPFPGSFLRFTTTPDLLSSDCTTPGPLILHGTGHTAQARS